MFEYRIESRDVKNLAKVLRSVSPELGREMRRTIRTAAKPVMDEMKAKIGANTMRATGGRGRDYDGPTGPGGITAAMVRSVSMQISAGRVRIWSRPGALGSAYKIPAYIDAGQSFRHPVYGNRKAWVSQTGSASKWFHGTAAKAYLPLRREVQETMDDIAARVAAMI